MKNYYDILQISRDADADQIRRAFRNMSLRYHPDRNGGCKTSEEKFKEVNEAYTVLKDPVRRWQYKQDLQRRPAGARSWRNGPAPGTAGAGPAKPPRWKAYRGKDGFRAARPAGTNAGGAFWSCVLFLVFLFPFYWSSHVPANAAAAGQERYEYGGDRAYAKPVNLNKELDDRYRRDIRHLNEILKVDPDLRRLDMETGYYELPGRSIRLSWDVLQLIREKHWKRQ